MAVNVPSVNWARVAEVAWECASVALVLAAAAAAGAAAMAGKEWVMVGAFWGVPFLLRFLRGSDSVLWNKVDVAVCALLAVGVLVLGFLLLGGLVPAWLTRLAVGGVAWLGGGLVVAVAVAGVAEMLEWARRRRGGRGVFYDG